MSQRWKEVFKGNFGKKPFSVFAYQTVIFVQGIDWIEYVKEYIEF